MAQRKKKLSAEEKFNRHFNRLKKRVESEEPRIILGKNYFDKAIQGLRDDVGAMKQDILGVKRDVVDVKQDVVGIKHRLDTNEEIVAEIKKKIDWMYEKIDWLYGEYEKHDTEHKLISNQLSKQSDDLEQIKGQIGITN